MAPADTAGAPQTGSPAAQRETRYVTASSLRVRAGPGTQYAQIGAAPRGSAVGLTGTQVGAWHEVRTTSGQPGWMHRDYLSRDRVQPALTRAAPVRVPEVTRGISAAEARRRIIDASIAGYRGNCPCPYNRDSAGRRCGGRSAYSRPGGASPICYEADVSDRMLAVWQTRN